MATGDRRPQDEIEEKDDIINDNSHDTNSQDHNDFDEENFVEDNQASGQAPEEDFDADLDDENMGTAMSDTEDTSAIGVKDRAEDKVREIGEEQLDKAKDKVIDKGSDLIGKFAGKGSSTGASAGANVGVGASSAGSGLGVGKGIGTGVGTGGIGGGVGAGASAGTGGIGVGAGAGVGVSTSGGTGVHLGVGVGSKGPSITAGAKTGNVGVNVTSKAAAGTGGAGFGTLILYGIFAIWISGIIMGLIFAPAMLKDGFVEGVVGFFKKITTTTSGAKGKVYKKDIYKLGDYARSKGFQLYSDGFIYEKLDKSFVPSGSRYIPEEGIAVDEEDKITALEVDNSPLKRYALMNAYTYTMENDQSQIMKKIGEIFSTIGNAFADLGSILSGEEKGIHDGNKFDGMLRFEHSPWNTELNEGEIGDEIAAKVFQKDAVLVDNSWISKNSIKIDMDKKTLSIKYGWFSNPYVFNIDGWAGRYGMPTEFLLALHKSIMAPDLIYEMTNGTKIENNKYKKTKMLIRLIKAKGNIQGGIKVPDDTSINGKLYDASHNEIDNTTIDFEKVKSGEVVYYAKTGTNEAPVYFPLKTTQGPVELKIPTNFDETNAVPITTGEEDQYDITYMYISLESEEPKVRQIPGYIVNAATVKDYLATFLNHNFGGKAEEKANSFVLNFGLHNLVRRYNEANGQTSIKKFADDLEAAVKAITDENYQSYLPLIYKIKDHWFRDVYFYMDEGEKYTLIDEDEFIKKGEYWTKFKGKNAQGTGEGKKKKVDYQKTDKAWSAYKIEEKPLENGKLNFKTYQIDEDDDKVHESIKRLQELGDVVQIKEDFNIQVTQTEDGRRGETNKRIKELFMNEKWYIYDGTEETAKKINEARKNNRGGDDPLKRRISKETDLLAGSLMLENMESLDSEYAFRDYKELLLELDYYTVDDLSERIRRVLTWPVPGASVGRTWPDTLGTKDESEFGVKILTKEGTDKLIEEKLKDESGNPLDGDAKEKALAEAKELYGEGFEPDQEVVSPATGKIISQDENKIEIMVLHNKDDIEEYKDFYEDEYRNGVAGYTITIQNINVAVEDKSLYKPQISEKEIEKLSTEEQKKKVKTKEDRKKDAPNLVGEYIKEGTVIGKTTDKDIQILMTNIDNEIVEHIDKYLLVPYANLRVELLDDYLTKIIDGEPNQLAEGDVASFKKMFPKDKFPVINENAEGFLEMQAKYGVNAIFAAAVSITESSGGTNFSAIPRDYNNIFSIKGDPNSKKTHHYDVGPGGGSTWRKYKTVKDSILDFGRLIKEVYHSENRDYVSEIGPKYCPGEQSIKWVDNVNQFITAALKRFQESKGEFSESSDNQNQDNNGNNEGSENPQDPTEIEVFEKNPFDLLSKLEGAGSDQSSESGDYGDSIFDGEVEYLNGTYYFNQADAKWQSHTYGGKSISGNACGPFSSAIAFSAALGKPLDPIDLVNYAANNGHQMGGGGSKWSLFPALGKRFGVPVKEVNSAAADKALENGCVLIISQSAKYWTNGGHFITVVKKTSDGQYLVNDPAYRRKSKVKHPRSRVYNGAKAIWAIGPTEAIRKMQAGELPPSGPNSGGGGNSGKIPTTARAAFDKIASEKNLTTQEKNDWSYIINRESSWNVKAKNPSSGAYGLPQALPGSKMKSHGSDWKTNPETQLRWMYDYMKGRYGGISKARQFWDKHRWY